MSKRKGNAADLAPSKKEKKGIGQIILGFFLFLYTLDYLSCLYLLPLSQMKRPLPKMVSAFSLKNGH